MMWTNEMKLRSLMRLPWTIVPDTTPEGDRLLRCVEIPSAVGSGDTDEDLARDFWDSMRESLAAYLHFGDPIPLPAGATLPWERQLTAPGLVVRHVEKGDSWGQVEAESTTASATAPAGLIPAHTH